MTPRKAAVGPPGFNSRWPADLIWGQPLHQRDNGGRTAAVLRSFVSSCKRVGVEPFAWFHDVLSRVASHPVNRLAELLPHNSASAQAR